MVKLLLIKSLAEHFIQSSFPTILAVTDYYSFILVPSKSVPSVYGIAKNSVLCKYF